MAENSEISSDFKADSIGVKLTMSDYDVLSSGSVIIPDGQYVEFMVENLPFRFQVDNSTPNESGINAELKTIDNKEVLVFTFHSVADGAFGSLSKPSSVANINGKKLSVIFSIRGFDSKPSGMNIMLFYTWLLEK